MPTETPKLFLWKDTFNGELGGYPHQYNVLNEGLNLDSKFQFKSDMGTFCPYCKTSFEITVAKPLGISEYFKPKAHDYRCNLCGFWYSSTDYKAHSESFIKVKAAVIRSFEINDSQVALDELGSHLKRKFSDIYSLSPRRFEELVADIYKNMGFLVRLTQQSRDGGVDLYLMERGSEEQIIVECKRYSNTRSESPRVCRRVYFLRG